MGFLIQFTLYIGVDMFIEYNIPKYHWVYKTLEGEIKTTTNTYSKEEVDGFKVYGIEIIGVKE